MKLHIDDLLKEVVKLEGSDLHIMAGVPPTARVHGRLQRLGETSLTPKDCEALVLEVLDETQRARLDQHAELDFAYFTDNTRFRVDVFRQRGSIAAAFRVIPPITKSFAELGLPRETMQHLALTPRGLVIITGPTGAGKSTTLAAMIDYINTHRDCHIVTIEDPIEFHHTHNKSLVAQREVGPDTASFADALKYVLRQDPDVILIGEMRDLETVRAALTAAETGHLVLTTLHTQDAVQTCDRIVDVFPSEQQRQVRVQLAATLQGVVSQQLLRGEDGQERVLATEVLLATPAIRNLIREGKSSQVTTVLQTSQKDGMHTLDQDLARSVQHGRVSLQAALECAVDPAALRQQFGRGA
jgi:twitching motility protein PilT